MLYEKPDNIFTAKFLGNPPMNLINIFVEKDENFLSSMDEKHLISKNFKNKTYLGIRPEDIEISKEGIKCLINDIDYQGADIVLNLKLGNQEIFARLDSKKVEDLDKEVFINWNEENLHFFDFESGERIFENS